MSVTRTVLREQIKEVLVERILSGHYKPGDRLIELHIAQEFGTSQAPVREALRDLESLRFVGSEAFRGTRVRSISRQELAEIYPVRAALEGLAAHLAVERAPDDLLDRLTKQYRAMCEAAEKSDLHDQVHHDVELHRLIVEASGNSILMQVWQSLRVEVRTLVTAVETEMNLRDLADAHLPILEAFAVRDAERADTVVRLHLLRFGDLLLKGL
ncbi:MAG: GntR family transcriptional regulator [Chloroflexota bacterium]